LDAFNADVAWGQIQGTRESQQDKATIVSWPNGFRLLILADGMGGYAGGKEASEAVVGAYRDSFVSNATDDIGARLLKALEVANISIYHLTRERPELLGMGATLVALVFDGSSVQWISVGDSPLWIYRNGEIRRLNANHSMAALFAERVARGEMTAQEAATSPERSQLLEAVLGKDIEQVDLQDQGFPVQAADVFLLASDGVETCSPAQIEELLTGREMTAENIVKRILDGVEAQERRSQDNATVVALRVTAVVSETDTHGRRS